MDYLNILKSSGDFISNNLIKLLNFFTQTTSSKILGIILFLMVGYIILKVITKGIKWAIILLVIYAIVSLGVSIWV